MARAPNCADVPHTNSLPNNKVNKASVMKGKYCMELGKTSAKYVMFVPKKTERHVSFHLLSLSCLKKHICRFAFLCRRVLLFRNGCGNCAICSTVVTFNVPEKWGCHTGER